MKSKLIITGLMLESLLASAADMTRDDINKQLEKIAKEPAPQKLAKGAMCYKVAMPPDRIEYYCPVCKTRTFYNRALAPMVGLTKIEEIRKWPAELKKLGLNCKIDESDFCPKCSKNKNQVPALYWEITVGKQKIRNKVENVDYQILAAFMVKKAKVKTFNGGEVPLKKYLPRLRQLLGMTKDE